MAHDFFPYALVDNPQFGVGDRIRLTVAVMGDDHAGFERTYPAGSVGRIDAVEDRMFHVTIGEGDDMIVQTFDEHDYAGGYPFEEIN